jgi:hypothetical protein
MNDMAARKDIQYLEIVHRPSGRTVAFSCPWCSMLWDAQDDLAVAGSECGMHVQTCEKRGKPPVVETETP